MPTSRVTVLGAVEQLGRASATLVLGGARSSEPGGANVAAARAFGQLLVAEVARAG